ncbi:hypothetical protein CCR97_02670 [Rhodoplanes elegans]|uniref:Uncharacterized protein n=1 Tax=Rhodoplanes elegans TaxID=29408 RepID=A0A327KQU0_9BRAD|nr:hypothetical protein [Rhodoplanes elegans]MBK5957118.1 hypothetical protein [Rhodoplanes elegans]RAI39722.1 hypothetical protein CH338_08530 [Rhodoplanes elegans]
MSAHDDPILAAIETHRTAHAAWLQAAAEEYGAPGDPEARAHMDLLRAKSEAAAWALLEVMPSTPTGLLTLATYAGDFVVAGHAWPEGWDQRFYAVVVRWPGE